MTLRSANNLLISLIVLVNLYVILTPFVPAFLFQASAHSGREAALTKKIQPSAAPTAPQAAGQASKPNEVIIPAMLLDQPVLEGRDTYAVLNHGILRWPAGSTPDKGGNTVLVGHRFTYSLPKGVFYYLDKLKTGDEIGLVWNNKQYTYRVTSTTVVPPTDVSIENQTADARLTMFTCTPLLWPKNRLVVVAALIHPPADTPKESQP